MDAIGWGLLVGLVPLLVSLGRRVVVRPLSTPIGLGGRGRGDCEGQGGAARLPGGSATRGATQPSSPSRSNGLPSPVSVACS